MVGFLSLDGVGDAGLGDDDFGFGDSGGEFGAEPFDGVVVAVD